MSAKHKLGTFLEYGPASISMLLTYNMYSNHAQCILIYGKCQLLNTCVKTHLITFLKLKFAYITCIERHIAPFIRKMATLKSYRQRF